VGVASEANETDTPQSQHPDCPDNGFLRFDDWQGTFESPMHIDRSPDKAPCFLARLHKAGIDVKVVVKFVYNYSGTYGTAVHQFLHGLGLAPRLYSAVDLHRGLVMVVMEHLDFREGTGGWVELGAFEKRLGNMADAVRSKLERIIALLQEKRMVHADLRPKNIMVKVDGQHRMIMSKDEPVLSLIDFDWAGMVGEVRYPPFLNPRVPWPEGAGGYEKVGHDDDRILLSNWWGLFVQPAKSS
jgi:hypothetical protein